MDPCLPTPPRTYHAIGHTLGRGGAYSTPLLSAAKDTYVLVAACCATSRERTREGAWGGCQGASTYVVAEELYVLERSVMYTVNSCVGEGGEEVMIVSNVAKDI